MPQLSPPLPNLASSRASTAVNLAFTALFLLALLTPGAVMVFKWDPPSLNYENRFLAAFPKLPFLEGDWMVFPKQFERWFNDRFGLRIPMVKIYSSFKYFVLGTNKLSNVLIGKGGWLFYTRFQKHEDPIECYRGTNLFKSEELDRIRYNLEAWRNWLASKGIDFVVLIGPNKTGIYDEYLPSNITKISAFNRLDQLAADLKKNSDVTLVDPRNEMLVNKAMPLYFRTDSHWTELGAFIAYRSLVQELRAKPRYAAAPEADLDGYSIVVSKKRTGGDLANMLIIDDFLNDYDVKMHARAPEAVGELKKAQPKVMLYGDSFSAALFNFFNTNFNLVQAPIYAKPEPEMIEKVMPDLVVLEIVERDISSLAHLTEKIHQRQ